MVLIMNKSNQFSASSSASNAKKGVENLPRKDTKRVNHWAYLDEIEAPMWTDLTLECDSGYDEKDDQEWFSVSHPIHQLSSRKLRSSSFQSGDCILSSNTSVQGTFSPKLPQSVSKSRGKDYKSRNLEPVKCRFTSNKQHQIKSLSLKSSITNIGSEKSYKNPALDGGKSSSGRERTLTASSKSVSYKGKEKISTSTITSEATERKFNVTRKLTPSSRSVSCKGKEKISTSTITSEVTERKFNATIKASRVVEVKNLDGRKSCSSKSSVGSSSYPGADVNNNNNNNNNVTPAEKVDKTPVSRITRTISRVPIRKVNGAEIYWASTAKARVMSSNPNLLKNEHSKITMDHNKQAKVGVTQKCNERVPLAAVEKNSTRAKGTDCSFRTVTVGKENQIGRLGLCSMSSTK